MTGKDKEMLQPLNSISKVYALALYLRLTIRQPNKSYLLLEVI